MPKNSALIYATEIHTISIKMSSALDSTLTFLSLYSKPSKTFNRRFPFLSTKRQSFQVVVFMTITLLCEEQNVKTETNVRPEVYTVIIER